jgi:hypothetical protein
MSFETVSLLLNWVQLGALLAILFRLGHTFELIASTQRELRRAIHHLGEDRAASSSPRTRAGAESTMVPTIWPASRLRSTVEQLTVLLRCY